MTKRHNLIIVALVSLALFMLLLFNLSSSLVSSADSSINSYMSSHQNSLIIEISKAIGYLLDPVCIIILAMIISVVMFRTRLKKDSIFFSSVMLLGGSFIYITKEIVQKARPINALVQETGFSFPSGHTLISVIFFGFFIYLALKRIKSTTYKAVISILLIISILFIGLSRLVLNVHWLSDVLGGFLLGLFILLSFIVIPKYISH